MKAKVTCIVCQKEQIEIETEKKYEILSLVCQKCRNVKK